MFSFLRRTSVWLLRKIAVAALIVALGWVAYAEWLFLHDSIDLETRREQNLNELVARRDELVAKRKATEEKIEKLRLDLHAQQERADRAGRVIETLESLSSRWERWFGNAEQQRLNDAGIARLQTIRTDANKRTLDLQRDLTQAAWDRETGDQQIENLDRQIGALQKARSPVIHYLDTAARRGKWVAVAFVALYFFGPWIGRLLAYFSVGPFISRGAAICFDPDSTQMPEVSVGEGSIIASLWPGEILAVRSRFLSEHSDALRRRRRFLLKWSLPLTSTGTGLMHLLEFQNRHAGGEQRVTLAGSGKNVVEFAQFQIAEGGSLVLRPCFVAGVIHHADQPLVIRSRWRLFHRQSWVTFQFRFLEFVGPCRVIVASPGGLRIEQLAPREAGPRPMRRLSPLAVIGFTSNIDFALVRTERFWRYLNGDVPLIELRFSGPGLFLAKEGSIETGNRLVRFCRRRRDRLLRVFGA